MTLTANAKLIKLEKKKMKRNKQTHAKTSKHNIRTCTTTLNQKVP